MASAGLGEVQRPGMGVDGSFEAIRPCSSLDKGVPEMHVRMCKKIAQLTKVIYALNAKNDEHEASIQTLKEAHQEETQHFLAEARNTVLRYKKKVEEAQELQKQVQTLENTLERYLKLTNEASSDCPMCGKQIKGRESQGEAKQGDVKVLLPREMSHMKLNLENQHQTSNRELDGVVNKHWTFTRDCLENKGKSTAVCSMDMQTFIREKVNREKPKLAEDWTKKGNQPQASYEKETWGRAMQESVACFCREWQQKETEGGKTHEDQRTIFQHQIEILEAKDQRISELEKYSQKLKEKMQDLEEQIKEVQQVALESQNIRKTLEEELVIAKERLLLQERKAVGHVLGSDSSPGSEMDEQRNQFLPCQQVSPTKKSQGDGNSQSEGASKQQKDSLKQHKEKAKGIEQLSAQSGTRNEEKLRFDSGGAPEAKQTLSSFQKEKMKEIQDLQEERYYQKTELQAQEAGEYWKKKYNDRFKAQQQSHHLEIQGLEEKRREALQSECESIQKQQSLLIESLRMELSEQQVSYSKEKEDLQTELKNMMAVKRQQEGSYQTQVELLKDKLEKCQNEISGLKKENSLLKDTMDLLNVEVALQKQTSAKLQDRVNQQRRLKESEENPRKSKPTLEDLHLIKCFQDKRKEKDETTNKLMDGNFQPSLSSSTEPYRNRSSSFNTNSSMCSTPMAKQKKKMDDIPSRIVSVPNLASYAKRFLNGDLGLKRNPTQITKSTSLEQNSGCVSMCYPSVQASESKPAPQLQSNETPKPKAQKSDPHHEWFTKYFSF